jgi:hypothetical protein
MVAALKGKAGKLSRLWSERAERGSRRAVSEFWSSLDGFGQVRVPNHA